MELEIIDVVKELEAQLKREQDTLEEYENYEKRRLANHDAFWSTRKSRKLFTKNEVDEAVSLNRSYQMAVNTKSNTEYSIQMIRAMLGRLYILME